MTGMLPRFSLLLALAVTTVLGCATGERSRDAVGTYSLTAYRWDTVDLPLPYRGELITPGDSQMWDAATLILQEDSNWRAFWHHAFYLGGTWEPFHTDTVYGVYSTIPPPTGWEIALSLETSPYTTQGGPAFIRGERLYLYNFWVFHRQ